MINEKRWEKCNHWTLWAISFAFGIIGINTILVSKFVSPDEPSVLKLSIIVASFISFHLSGFFAIALTLRFKISPGKRLKEIYLDKRISLQTILTAVKLVLILVPVTMLLNAVIQIIMTWLNYPLPKDPVINWLRNAPHSSIVILLIGAIVIAPITEEIMFRVVLHKAFMQFFGKSTASIFTSIAFAVSHFKLEQILPLFVLAMVLQRMLERTKNLLLPIIIHSLFNGIMLIMILLWRYFSNSIGT